MRIDLTRSLMFRQGYPVLTTVLFWALTFCVVAAFISGFMLLALKVENRRFWKVHQARTLPVESVTAKANLIIPCKGVDEATKQRLESFFLQDHPNFRITFAAESATDPVVPVIRELQAQYRSVESSIVIAGRASNRGQKVHNLLAAIEKLQVQVDILAFADVDVTVSRSWLRWLTIGVGRQGIGARTGYRWMTPANKALPTLIGVNLNNAIASCLGKGNHNLVWGGSWAIHRKVFESIGLREAWTHVLSDDLMASRVIRESEFAGERLKIQFEPQCLCATEVSFTWAALSEFVTRQLKITRLYVPRQWATALFSCAVNQVAFWGSIAAWLLVMSTGDRGLLPTTLMFSFIGIYVLGVARASIRQNMGRRVVSGWRQFKRARRLDLFAWPISGAFALFALLRSSIGNKVTWSNIRYRVSEGGRTTVLGRNIESAVWPVRSRVKETQPLPATIPFVKKNDSTETPVEQVATNDVKAA